MLHHHKRQVLEDFGLGDDITNDSLNPLAKWVLILSGLLLLLLCLVGARMHALHRASRGMPLGFYNRWLLSKAERERPPLELAFQPPAYDMSARPASVRLSALPPPAYEATGLPPPSYQPPSKAKVEEAGGEEGAVGGESYRPVGGGGEGEQVLVAQVPLAHAAGLAGLG